MDRSEYVLKFFRISSKDMNPTDYIQIENCGNIVPALENYYIYFRQDSTREVWTLLSQDDQSFTSFKAMLVANPTSLLQYYLKPEYSSITEYLYAERENLKIFIEDYKAFFSKQVIEEFTQVLDLLTPEPEPEVQAEEEEDLLVDEEVVVQESQTLADEPDTEEVVSAQQTDTEESLVVEDDLTEQPSTEDDYAVLEDTSKISDLVESKEIKEETVDSIEVTVEGQSLAEEDSLVVQTQDTDVESASESETATNNLLGNDTQEPVAEINEGLVTDSQELVDTEGGNTMDSVSGTSTQKEVAVAVAGTIASLLTPKDSDSILDKVNVSRQDVSDVFYLLTGRRRPTGIEELNNEQFIEIIDLVNNISSQEIVKALTVVLKRMWRMGETQIVSMILTEVVNYFEEVKGR